MGISRDSRLLSKVSSYESSCFWSLGLFDVYFGLSEKNKKGSASLRHIQWGVLCVVFRISFATENLRHLFLKIKSKIDASGTILSSLDAHQGDLTLKST
jgi:hypothetical protein